MKSLPTTSSRRHPNVRSASWFHSSITISSLTETKASWAVSRTARASAASPRVAVTRL